MRKIGISAGAYPGITYNEQLEIMSHLGFDVVFEASRADDELKELAKAQEKYNMISEMLHAPFRGINKIWLDCIEGDEMLSHLKRAVDRCHIIGAGICVVHLSSGMNPPTITDIGRGRFDRLVEHAASEGIKIAFENQRRLDNLAWAMERYTDDNVVGFCWDCGHENCFTQGREYMPLFGNRMICNHIHDNSGIFNSDDHMIPFDGTIDYQKVVEHIRKSGYTGTLTLEIFSSHADIYNEITASEYYERAATAANRLRDMVDCE